MADLPILPPPVSDEQLAALWNQHGFARIARLSTVSWAAVGDAPVEFIPSEGQFEALWKRHPEHHYQLKVTRGPKCTSHYLEPYIRPFFYSQQRDRSETLPEQVRPLYAWCQQLIPEVNTCLINWYAHGRDHPSDHRESYKRNIPNTPSCTIFLGAISQIDLYPAGQPGLDAELNCVHQGVPLGHGSAVIFGDAALYTHHCSRQLQPEGKMISITFLCRAASAEDDRRPLKDELARRKKHKKSA